MGEGFSVELCGGTHVRRTGDIGLLRITAEQGVASGVRRIEAVTGPGALALMDETDAIVRSLAETLKTSREDLGRRVAALVEHSRNLEKQVEQLEGRLAAARGDELTSTAVDIAGAKVLATALEGADPKSLLTTLDQLKNKLGSGVVVLGAVHEGRVALIAGVTSDLTDRIRAGDVVKFVGEQTGARGGGRPDMARAGGGDRPEALPAALASVPGFVREALS
jgi:alanyl-tRNA synthetase